MLSFLSVAGFCRGRLLASVLPWFVNGSRDIPIHLVVLPDVVWELLARFEPSVTFKRSLVW